MGKNQRHQKKLKSERAKTHITSKTKFLPKGQNVTNTAFKIRPIIIQEQLKEKDHSQILSKRKQTIPELVSKLKHYNDTVKAEACLELQDLVKKHSIEIIHTHLSMIIQSSSLLIQDRESKVRRACVKLINEILINTPLNQLEPFFNFISTNLRCSMTNIDKNIQEDSLLLLDTLLENTPTLVANYSDRIFPDFLSLISKLRNESTLNRTLTMNLGSKMTAVKWRIKVLSRLYTLLDAMISKEKLKTVQNKTDVEPQIDSDGSVVLFRSVDVYEQGFKVGQAGSETVLGKHVVTLVPLLYETWLEVVPEKSLKKHGAGDATMLNEESAAILCSIVNILSLLYDYAQLCHLEIEAVFNSKECEKFLGHLLSHFPYAQGRKSSKQDSKLFISKDDPKCIEENLLICYVFVTLKINLQHKTSQSGLKIIQKYINKCLITANYVQEENLNILMLVLKEVLLKNPRLWEKAGCPTLEILENLIQLYSRSQRGDEVLRILTNYEGTTKSEKLYEWLGDLPKYLATDRVSPELVRTVLRLCRKNHQLVQKGVLNYLPEILGYVDKIPNPAEVFYIFYYVPNLNRGEVIKFLKEKPEFDNLLSLF